MHLTYSFALLAQTEKVAPTQNQILPADYPKYVGDDAAYAKAKADWIATHADEYKVLQQSTINPNIPIPTMAVQSEGTGNTSTRTYDRKQEEALQKQHEELQQAWFAQQQIILAQERAALEQDENKLVTEEPMFKIKSPTITPYMESIFLRIKEAEFPGDMMQLSNNQSQQSARNKWIGENADLYQLFIWAMQTIDGKIRITQKEAQQLSPALMQEIKSNINEYIILPN